MLNLFHRGKHWNYKPILKLGLFVLKLHSVRWGKIVN